MNAYKDDEIRAIFAKNLNAMLTKHNKSQIEVANTLGIKQSTFSSWCTGTKMPRMDKVQALADYFGVMKSDLIEDKHTLESIGATPYNPTYRVPILGRISAGLPLYAEEHIEGYTYIDLNGNHEYFALRVQGDSMNSRKIDDGDVVIIRRQSIVDNGDIAVVLVNGMDATIKQFYKNGDTVTLVPHSSNAEHTIKIYNCKDIEIRVLGRLVRNIIDF